MTSADFWLEPETWFWWAGEGQVWNQACEIICFLKAILCIQYTHTWYMHLIKNFQLTSEISPVSGTLIKSEKSLSAFLDGKKIHELQQTGACYILYLDYLLVKFSLCSTGQPRPFNTAPQIHLGFLIISLLFNQRIKIHILSYSEMLSILQMLYPHDCCAILIWLFCSPHYFKLTSYSLG